MDFESLKICFMLQTYVVIENMNASSLVQLLTLSPLSSLPTGVFNWLCFAF